MNQVKSIFMNISWLSMSQVITSICAFLWTIIIARYLGVTDYGIVSFAVSFNALLGIVMDLGMNTYITREIAKNRESLEKYVDNIFLFKLILAFVLFILGAIILYFMNYPFLTIVVTLIFTVELIFISMTNFLNGVFQAFENVKYQAIGTILNSILLLLGILVTIWFDFGVIAIAISYAFGYYIFCSYMLFKYIKTFSFPKFELDLKFIKEVFLNSIPFGLTNFFYTIYFSIDLVMLSYLVGDYSTGLYKSAYNIIYVFTTFFVVYQSVIFPILSKFFKESQDLLKITYELSVKYLLLIILPISIVIFFYARPLVDLIYTNQYSLASVPVQILIWTVSFLFINGAASTLLNAINKEFIVTKVYIAAAIFNVLLNLILIPMFDYNGAAMATVLSEILITVLTLYYIFKTDFKPDFGLFKTVIKIIFVSIIFAVVIYWANVSLWLAIPIGLVIYIVLLFVCRLIDNNDKYIINELLK
ncbi:MAG: flippase [Methanobrevibacter sp.]|uniref:flippase n=1 Tax=Methanobrevibacter sp. TaxID=66852 RepID=UPI0025F3F54D|nr:flippase [Methanobrevibacter sp.]MBQ6138741.1 flippase [Methanobrevibacter sp.]